MLLAVWSASGWPKHSDFCFSKTQGAFVNLLPSKEKGRKTAKVGLVLAGASALVVMGMAGPAAAVHDGQAHAEGSAATGTGIFDPVAQLIQTGICEADFVNGGPETTTGPCTSSIAVNPTQDVTRFATANVAGNGAATSSAEGGAADVNVIDLQDELNIEALLDNLAATNQGASAIGPILAAIGQVGNVLLGNTLAPVLDQVLDPILEGLDSALPLSLELGAVLARCNATASTATASSEVADLSLLVDVPNVQQIPVVFQTPVTAHSDLVMDAPQQLVDGILTGIRNSLLSAPGILQPILLILNNLVTNVQTQVLDPLLATLRPTLLSGLSDLLDPIVNGEVNHVTTPVASNDHTFKNLQAGPWSAPDEIALTALSLTVLGSNTLSVGTVHCGDNVDGAVHNGGNNPGLQVLKTEKVNGDDEAEWTIRVHNPLGQAVEDVFVKDFYPKELDEKDVKVSSISKGSFNKNTGVWTVGTLASGATETLRIKAELDEDDLADGVDNAICVNRTSKPNHIQKNDSFKDDTDGCDTANAKSDDNGDDDDDDSPKSINSGISGGNLSAAGLAGLLAMTAMGGSVARRRFNT
jgi:hypothetical protein